MSGSDLVHGADAERFGGWNWRKPHGGEHFRRCSFCGSVHPEDVAEEMSRGASADWADRKYGWPHKFYIQIPNRDPEATFCVGGQHGGDADRDPGEGYIHVGSLPPDLRAIAIRDGSLREDDPTDGPHWYRFGTRSSHFGKFYTAHLADPAISDLVKTMIARGSGVALTFEGGKVRWAPA